MPAGRRDAERRPTTGSEAADHAGRPADPVAVAREICLNQLAARARSRAELAATLRRRGVSEDVAEAVLDRLTAVGLVDDGAFAAAYISSARERRGLGRQALAVELRRRGIEPDIVDAATEVIDEADEEEIARDLVRRRLASMDRLPEQVRIRRLVAMLMRRGYSGGLAARVVREQVTPDDHESEVEEASSEWD
ncbi:recombination regulator RecX [Frankia sp. AgKG'84/4]|uniref:recombination regulator RecX n=1 Tax=Frankia sp. AgKG'84/4 TaxID=573490 RepID=UPI00200DE051|nr:recombination regulator RecX [Frankia sp. AgKG'84/4]MCL9795917.1 recombination regulator RecX [Frankia sp. AgKG'84/4]